MRNELQFKRRLSQDSGYVFLVKLLYKAGRFSAIPVSEILVTMQDSTAQLD